jgi:ornithine decarboxylase
MKMDEPKLLELAKKHGTPLYIIDHDIIREQYRIFNEKLPRVQVYYAIKANSEKEIIKTLFNEGASFDAASLTEFQNVFDLIKDQKIDQQRQFIWDKLIFSNTIKPDNTLRMIREYRPLVTYDNIDELKKIKKYCDTAGLVLRVKVPDTGSMVEMGGKFGALPSEAVDLVLEAFKLGLIVEGISFHVGSQCANFSNFIEALQIVHDIFFEAEKRSGKDLRIVDIGGGFPIAYDETIPGFDKLAEIINSEIDRLFKEDIEIIAEPGRFLVADAATLITKIEGRSRRDGGKRFYYINDGVYHTFSGVVFDHCVYHFKPFLKDKDKGKTEICAVVGPTCDSFDKVSLDEQLPGELEVGDFLITEKIGAYSTASSTNFNGIPGAKILHVNL